MYKYRKIISIVAAMLILFGALGFGGISRAKAIEPGLYEVDGNATCAGLYLLDPDLMELGPLFGFKYDGNPTENLEHTLTNDGKWVLETGTPSDSINSVRIFNISLKEEDGKQVGYIFDWAATLGIDAVIVKAKDSNAYVYYPEEFGDEGLHAIDYKAISHISFCYDYELTATKTAEAKTYKTIDWTITKDVTPPSASKFIGEDATFDYTVSVLKEETFGPWVVEGTITVKNPTPWPVEFEVTDKVGGVPATVDCGGVTTLTANDGLAGGADEVVCTYSISSATEIANGSNVATVISKTTGVGGYVTKAVPFVFGEPILSAGSEPELITVSDSNGEFWSTGVSATWNYSETQTCSTTTALYSAYGFYSTDYNNTAKIDQTTGDSDSEKVTLTCYAPVVSKDADTEWKKKYDWTITKSVDPAKHVGFVGDEFTSDYDVVVDQTITDYGYKAFGKIYVTNPAGSPGSITVDVSDEVNGTVASVDCDGIGGTNLTVPTGETKSCDYTVALTDGTSLTNTATVEFKEIDFLATANVIFGDPVIEGYPTISVTDSVQGSLGSASGDLTFEYQDTFTCSSNPADYKDGFDSHKYPNTATITETSQSDDAEVTVDCYAPVVSKDADTEWKKKYDWTITKSVDPAKHVGFVGDEFTSDYDVVVDQTITDYGYKAFGKIYVTNPAGSPGSITVDVSDEVNGTVASVDCDGIGGTNLTVPTGETKSCGYTVDLADTTQLINTATVMFNKVDFLTYADVIFGDPVIEGYPMINVTDSVQGPLGSASGDYTFEYSDTFTCSSNPADYKDGFDSDDYPNTATITETSQSDDAKVTVDCYAPVITKDANATYDERHTWDIEKSVDPTSQSGYPGDLLDWTWTVTVSETFVEETFLVTGKIDVTNPVGSPGDMTVSLVDQLSDGKYATVDCGAGATSITVIPGATGTCDYTAIPGGRTATLNTATGTFNSVDFVATADVSFGKTVVNGTATVTDTEIGLNEALTAGLGSWTFTKDYKHTCSTDREDYFVDGMYTQGEWSITNWAYVYSDGVEQDEDDATTTYTCDASFVDIYKTTNGDPADPTKDIRFALYSGTSVLSTVSTMGNGASLQFPTALVPGDSYTICEAPVPAGYTFEISVDGGNVLTFAGPPGETNPTGEIQCFDFTAPAETTTVVFNINNRYPGGAPRTPGYWKNWSTCSGGNQQYTAAALGGVEAGVYLLDDLLPQTLGNFEVTTCEIGVSILSAQDIVTGKNKANDAGYTLARALLAARLNQDAGACVPTAEMMVPWTTMSLEEVLTAADNLLIKRDYVGTGDVLSNKDKKVKDDYNYALSLAGIIDAYNNGLICTGEPSH